MRPPEVIPPSKNRVSSAQTGDTPAGYAFALTAFFIWGLLPLFIKLIDHIPAFEVIANRAFWSVPVAGLLLVVLGRTNDILPTLKSPRKLGILFLSALIISLNWCTYVWAVMVNRAVETAFGYYINPLITIAMGALILGEKLNRTKLVAIALATIGVVFLAVSNGHLPWVSLVLAFSFASYGFLRKTVDVGPTQGFFIEVLLMSILAVPYLVWLTNSGESHFTSGWRDAILLMLCGPITAIPLICYTFGAKGLRLSTIGILQYTVPTIVVLMGVFVFGEPFGMDRLIAFSFIWVALAIYTWSMLRGER